MSKLQFLIKKRFKSEKCSVVFFFLLFSRQNSGSGLDPDLDSHEMLDPDPGSINPDPQLITDLDPEPDPEMLNIPHLLLESSSIFL